MSNSPILRTLVEPFLSNKTASSRFLIKKGQIFGQGLKNSKATTSQAFPLHDFTIQKRKREVNHTFSSSLHNTWCNRYSVTALQSSVTANQNSVEVYALLIQPFFWKMWNFTNKTRLHFKAFGHVNLLLRICIYESNALKIFDRLL